MKKLFSLLVLSILLISLWGCKNKTAEFVVEKAFYYETNVETKSFFNNSTIAKDKLYRDYIILVTDFNYEVKSSNPNDLPKVKVGMINVTYVVKLNGKELVLGENNELPDMSPVTVGAGELILAPAEIAFIVM